MTAAEMKYLMNYIQLSKQQWSVVEVMSI